MRAFTVAEINGYVKNILEFDPNLTDVTVEGEVSNFKSHFSSGHLYFTLKDPDAAISAVMFSSDAAGLKFRPADGVKVKATGRVSLYVKDGRYQFYIRHMEPLGDGALLEAFNKLKLKLENEGLFDTSKKKSVPVLPKTVGIITSHSGAALRDVLNVLSRRDPGVQPLLYPVNVQGVFAAPELVRAVRWFDREKAADVLLVVRGGGSIEDLWAFNDEELARAIAACRIPVITGVGHETDFTIADFAADLRAPTPSAAAELAVPDVREELMKVGSLGNRLELSASRLIDSGRSKLAFLNEKGRFADAADFIGAQRDRLNGLSASCASSYLSALEGRRARLRELTAMNAALSPFGVLSRGYAAVRREGRYIADAGELNAGDNIELCMRDGVAAASVTGRED